MKFEIALIAWEGSYEVDVGWVEMAAGCGQGGLGKSVRSKCKVITSMIGFRVDYLGHKARRRRVLEQLPV